MGGDLLPRARRRPEAGPRRVLLDGATDLAHRHGARVIEAYPLDTAVRAASSPELRHGPLAVFLRAGFRQSAPGLHRRGRWFALRWNAVRASAQGHSPAVTSMLACPRPAGTFSPTRYPGTHYAEAFIVKNGVVVEDFV